MCPLLLDLDLAYVLPPTLDSPCFYSMDLPPCFTGLALHLSLACRLSLPLPAFCASRSVVWISHNKHPTHHQRRILIRIYFASLRSGETKREERERERRLNLNIEKPSLLPCTRHLILPYCVLKASFSSLQFMLPTSSMSAKNEKPQREQVLV